MTPAPLRLAFTHIPRHRWAGGYNYLRNLLTALARHQPGRFAPVVFASPSDAASDLDDLGRVESVEIVCSRAFDGGSLKLANALLHGVDRVAANAFRQHGIDVVVEASRFFGWRLPLPVLAWFPDMQHRRMPHLFSMSARLRRELGFRMQIAAGRTIMVSSESARRDCEYFYRSLQGRTVVVRFATRPAPGLLEADPRSVYRQYGLPDVFFHLPNQFWLHKNHRVVVDALALLSQNQSQVVVAVTGSPEDDRHPGHFRDLMDQVAARGLERNFRYLGMLPLSHVYGLMRTCTALINPSRFEGWSTTVEEAKSLGVPLILSDLEVHREQAGDGARYFSVDDPVGLSQHLEAVAAAGGPARARDVLPDVDVRVAAFSSAFSAAVDHAYRRP